LRIKRALNAVSVDLLIWAAIDPWANHDLKLADQNTTELLGRYDTNLKASW
jgi:hypothetical protein